MRFLIRWLLEKPGEAARRLAWLAPLFARIVVGYVFLVSGWATLHSLPELVRNVTGWGFPQPAILASFAAGSELVGGALLLAGLLTRVCAAALGVMLIIAIAVADWPATDSLQTLLRFEETQYLALLLWLATSGAGPLSLDHLIRRAARVPRGEAAAAHGSGEAQSGA